MKTLLAVGLIAAVGPLVQAQNKPMRRDPPPLYTSKAAAAAPAQTYVYEQTPTPGQPILVTREQADGVVSKFREAYPKLGSPRVLIYVNRELVDTESGMKLTSRNEKVDTTRSKVDSTIEPNQNLRTGNVTINSGGNATVSGGTEWDFPGKGTFKKRTDSIRTENRYSTKERKQTLADRQTVRDLERLFGRPLRAAGVTLSDQGTATQLIANRPIKQMMVNTEGEQARKDREALKNIADVAIEILISSRTVNVAEVSGDKTYASPDIQATAIRLSDAKILGQASSRDVVGKDRYSGRILRNFDVEEIAEATALALMEDMAMVVTK